MATELTQVYLEREQKKALQARARAHGTKVAEEVRRAVDAYLAGVSAEDLKLLDEGSRKAARHLSEMSQELDRINARLDEAFGELSGAKRSGRAQMSMIADILERLSGVEVVKERLRETGARVEQWAAQTVALDRHVQDIDRRLVRIETLADVARTVREFSKTQ
jgi:hypothetical protein